MKKVQDNRRNNYVIFPIKKGEGLVWRMHIYNLKAKEHRITVQRKSQDELLHYATTIREENVPDKSITFTKLFKTMISNLMIGNINMNTIRRYEQYFNRFYSGKGWTNKPIYDVTSDDIGNWAENEILNPVAKERVNGNESDTKLKKKEFQNMVIVLKKVFCIAVNKGYISENPVMKMKVNVPFGEKRAVLKTYTNEEKIAIIHYSNTDFENTGDLAALVPQLVIMTDMSETECLALHWSDISEDKKTLKICRLYKRDSFKTENGTKWHDKRESVMYSVETNHFKTISLTPELNALFERISLQRNIANDEIFIRNDGTHITPDMVKSKWLKYNKWMKKGK
jgi:integrase